jgi:hypothetical protein
VELLLAEIPQKNGVIHSLSTGLLLNPVQNLSHLVIQAPALFHQICDLLVGIHNRGVVSVSKQLADFGKRKVRLLAD